VVVRDEFDVPLQVRLLFDDKPRTTVEKDILEVDPPMPQMGKNGKCTFRVRIRDVSMSFENREFCLSVSATSRAGRHFINPIISDPMTVSSGSQTLIIGRQHHLGCMGEVLSKMLMKWLLRIKIGGTISSGDSER